MSVLDELKKEAESVKARAERSRHTEEVRHEAILNELRPKMEELHRYFKELAESLAVVAPDVRADFEVSGFGPLKGLLQQGYRISTPDNRALAQFTFHFNCLSEGSVKFQVKGKEAAERQRQGMWDHNLRFTSKLLADGTGVFNLEKFVPVTLEFESQPGRGAVRLRIRNLQVLGTNTVYFEPERLTVEFCEELGKAVLRKANRFDELSGNRLSYEARKRLRQQLVQDGYQRLNEARGREEDPGQRSSRRRGFLRGLLRRS